MQQMAQSMIVKPTLLQSKLGWSEAFVFVICVFGQLN